MHYEWRSEHLCRYVLRPPVAQEALELAADGTVLLRIRRPWRDGTRAIRFTPSELLEKLAAMIPKPRLNLLVYHGVFAPNARYRPGAVRAAQEGASQRTAGQGGGAANEGGGAAVRADASTPPGGAAPADAPGPSTDSRAPTTPRSPPAPAGYTRPAYYAWAELLRRTFAIDVLDCPDCGGRLRLLSTIADRTVIEKILRHLGLPVDVPQPARARAPAWWPGLEAAGGVTVEPAE
jgi:hypothetical protein